MKNYISLLLLLLLSVKLCGQASLIDSVFEPKLCGEVFENSTAFKGSPYFNNEWAPADILLSNGEKVCNKLLKYNGFLDEVIWKNEIIQQEVKLEKHFIDEFTFKNFKGKSIRFKRLKTKISAISDTGDFFMEVLAESNSSCYVYRHCTVKGYDLKDLDGKTYISNQLVSQPIYLLVLNGKETVFLKRINKRVLLKSLPDAYRIAAKEILQKNHLAMRNEDNLRMLVLLLK